MDTGATHARPRAACLALREIVGCVPESQPVARALDIAKPDDVRIEVAKRSGRFA